MLKIIDRSDLTNIVPAIVDETKLYVRHSYGGNDTLNFEIAVDNPAYRYIVEETKIEYRNNRYIVKLIDEHSDFVVVRCNLDYSDFKQTVLLAYRRTNTPLASILNEICTPLGWTYTVDPTLAQRATIEESEGTAYTAVTPFEVLQKASEVYGCVYVFNTIAKTIAAKDVNNISASGQFFSDELNLKSVGFVGNSDNLITRLYAYGKKDNNGNPLTFALINDGKPYVDDNTYSDKVVVAVWSDERYTVAENLLADAQTKLAEMAKPVRSYTCDVKDVGEGVWLYKVVTLIDRRHRVRVNHMIVEYDEYEDSSLNTIVLSTLEQKILGKFESLKESVAEEIVQRDTAIGTLIEAEIQRANNLINGSNGGRFKWLYDGSGYPIELINYCAADGSYPEDVEDQSTWQNMWRWNAYGLGFSSNGGTSYDIALTKDGKINASMITTGVLNAGLIVAGALQSVDHSAVFDLDHNYLHTERTVGGHVLASRMTTGAYRLLFDTHEIGALGTISGTKGSPWFYYNDQYADELNIGSGSDGVTHPNITVKYSQIDFKTSDVRRGYIDDDGYHGTIHGVVHGYVQGELYVDIDGTDTGYIYAGDPNGTQGIALRTTSSSYPVMFCPGGTKVAWVESDGIHGTLSDFETWKSGTYATDKSTLQDAIGGKAASNHSHTNFGTLRVERLNIGASDSSYKGYIYAGDSGEGIALRTTASTAPIMFCPGGTLIASVKSDGIHGTLCDPDDSHRHQFLGTAAGASINVGNKNLINCYKDGSLYCIDVAADAWLDLPGIHCSSVSTTSYLSTEGEIHLDYSTNVRAKFKVIPVGAWYYFDLSVTNTSNSILTFNGGKLMVTSDGPVSSSYLVNMDSRNYIFAQKYGNNFAIGVSNYSMTIFTNQYVVPYSNASYWFGDSNHQWFRGYFSDDVIINGKSVKNALHNLGASGW